MKLYPVIMCGGSGTRLWPISRPFRPKQFVSLVGERTLFQETVARVGPLAEGGGELVVVAGARQGEWIAQQLEGRAAHVILEPTGRDSAPAIAAAAHHVAGLDPDGIAVVVASDHHIPDAEAFRDAIREAAERAAGGDIVTLGIRPRAPSSAYGYIQPADEAAVSAVAAFVEKPDAATAARYIASGYLWNSGNFIARARTLLDELELHAPDVASGTAEALRKATQTPHGTLLAPSFATVPKVSIDYAVMEHTERAAVVAAQLDWSDLGAWDAIHAALPKDDHNNALYGSAEAETARDSLVFNATGAHVVLDGVEGLNVVVDDDAILVSRLDRAQDVKQVVARIPERLRDIAAETFDLRAQAARLESWLFVRALPLWWSHGYDHEAGMWREELAADGRLTSVPARARVQGRQTWVFGAAGGAGWRGPWPTIVRAGVEGMRRYAAYDRPLLRSRIDRDGAAIDATHTIYDQAFAILALSASDLPDAEARALGFLDALEAHFPTHGEDGLRENGERPYQANAHMHLMECALAWVERSWTERPWASRADASPRWRAWVDRIERLARERMVVDGALREFFDSGWKPLADDPLVETGHQFEWAWLLQKAHRSRGGRGVAPIADGLFRTGLRGVHASGFAADHMDVRDGRLADRARLWPQTEWLKASLLLMEDAEPEAREAYRREAARALRALDRYLVADGLWRDKLQLDEGRFVVEPSPASSLYHITAAVLQMRATALALQEAD